MGDLLWSLAGEGPELVQASRPGSPPPPHLSCRHRRWQVTRMENLQQENLVTTALLEILENLVTTAMLETLETRLASCALASLPLVCGQIGYALKHTTPEHKAGEIGLKAVKQNGHALRHAAPEHKADESQ